MLKTKNIVSYNCLDKSSNSLYIREVFNRIRKYPEVVNAVMFSIGGDEDESAYYIFFDCLESISIPTALRASTKCLTDIATIDHKGTNIAFAFEDGNLAINDLIEATDLSVVTFDTTTGNIEVQQSTGAVVGNEKHQLGLQVIGSFKIQSIDNLIVRAIKEGVFAQEIISNLQARREEFSDDTEDYKRLCDRITTLRCIKDSLQLDYISKKYIVMLLELTHNQLS